jgi:hypothetical protein
VNTLPASVRCDQDRGCTFVVVDGELSPRFRDHVERDLFADPLFPPGPRVLLDVSTVADTDQFTPDVVSAIARNWRELPLEGERMSFAIVARGLWNQAAEFADQLDTSGIRVITFNLVDAAATWLGLEPGEVSVIIGEMRAQLRA